MKTNLFSTGLFALVILSMGVHPATAAEFSVTVTNTTRGIYFTPLLITAHDDAGHLFQLGQAASADLQAMAEGGDISGLLSALGGADEDTVENPAAGLLAPGASITANFNSDASGNTRLSLVAMLLPTNDGFVGLDSLEIPAATGSYVYYLNAYDAGTEANDEILVAGAGGTPGTPGIPADPGGSSGANGTGVTTAEENATIHIHRGVLGDTDATGGISDLDSRVHRWLNPVAKLTIDVQ